MDNISDFLLNKLDKLEEKLDQVREDQAETRAALIGHERRDEEIHVEVKKITSELINQSKLLGDYNHSLREHMRRTELLENKLEPIHIKFEEDKLKDSLKMKTWKKVLAILGGLATIAALAVSIAELMGLL